MEFQINSDVCCVVLCDTDDSEFNNSGDWVGEWDLGDILFGCKDHQELLNEEGSFEFNVLC